jgi:hypothetical protein
VLRQRHAQAGSGTAAQDELALMRAMLARLDEIAANLRPPQD